MQALILTDWNLRFSTAYLLPAFLNTSARAGISSPGILASFRDACSSTIGRSALVAIVRQEAAVKKEDRANLMRMEQLTTGDTAGSQRKTITESASVFLRVLRWLN
jgi:hypothetical protein